MKYCIFLLLIVLQTTVNAQKTRPVLFVPKAIEGSAVNIPGTQLVVTAPAGFKVSQTFTGLQNGKSLIEFFDLPGGAYKVLSQDFTREKFLAQGVNVFEVEDVSVNGFSGRLISLQQQDEQRGFSLVFGDDTFSVIAVASYPSDNSDEGESIRDALLSIKYGASSFTHTQKGGAFSFLLDDSRSPFRYQTKSANTFYYTPATATAISGSPYVTVTQLTWDYSTSPATIGELMIKEMKRFGIENPSIKKESSRAINGYNAYESEIYASRDGEKCLIYQMVVVHDARAIVVHGIGKDDFRKNRDAFRKLAHTIRFK